MTNLDSILKSRDITLLTKVCPVKAMVFPVVMYGCEHWTIKKAKHQSTDAFELWCRKRLLRVPWTARRSNQYILKEINPEYSLERLMLKLRLQYFGYLMRTDSLEKTWCWERLKSGEKGTTEDEMVGWHHWLDGHEFEQGLGVGDGQGSLACCSPWGHKESGMTVRLNWLIKDMLEIMPDTIRPKRISSSLDVTPWVYTKPPWILMQFKRLLSIYSYYKILAILPVLYNISLSLNVLIYEKKRKVWKPEEFQMSFKTELF